MAEASPARARLGGLGALLFLGTLGAIAVYVQQRETPERPDLQRTAATVPTEAPRDELPPAMPWQDRLDVREAQLVPIASDAAAAASPATAAPAPAPDAGAAAAPAVDPSHARYVQSLPDGHKVLLTLDPVLHAGALQIFRNYEVPYGGAVVIDLRDNAVLAFAGHSSMDPDVHPHEVLVTPWAPAASVFKLVTAAALLEQEQATSQTKVCFSGGLHGIDAAMLTDNPARDVQCATLSDAIAHSYNLVLGKLAMKHLQPDGLMKTARALGWDRDIGFEIAMEPSPAHLPGDRVEFAKVAAGFWSVDLSPLHAALVSSVLARGGVEQPPYIAQHVLDPAGSDVTPARASARRTLAESVARDVGRMMLGTTTEGTARKSFRDEQGRDYIPGVAVAGKTGSLTAARAPGLNYNWFVGYAPADAPEIAFAVVVANEPAWRIKAHYAARRLVQIYLERRDAIARRGDARLAADGRVLQPERDATGAVVAAAAGAGSSAAARAPVPSDAEPPLPPAPGPVAPRPQAQPTSAAAAALPSVSPGG